MPTTKPLLTAEQVAEVFAVHRNTVFKWVRDGKLTPVRMSRGVIRFSPEEVDRIVAEGGAR